VKPKVKLRVSLITERGTVYASPDPVKTGEDFQRQAFVQIGRKRSNS
jgi:hypothetical protein